MRTYFRILACCVALAGCGDDNASSATAGSAGTTMSVGGSGGSVASGGSSGAGATVMTGGGGSGGSNSTAGGGSGGSATGATGGTATGATGGTATGATGGTATGGGGSGGGMNAGTCPTPIDISDALAATGKYSGSVGGDLPFEPSFQCNSQSGPASVLYWQVPAAGNYRLTVSAPNGDPIYEDVATITVRTDCHKPMSEIACDYLQNHQVFFGLPAPAGVFIQVAGLWYENGYTLSVVQEPACATNPDCIATTFVCIAGACAECTAAADCSNQVCDEAFGQCTGCSSDGECAGNPNGSYCTSSGYCNGCTSDAECAADPAGHVCDLATHSCSCVTPVDCSAGAQCISAVCATCLPGQIDCNGLPGDACEVDPQVNPTACGGCTSCAGGGCNAGVCSPAGETVWSGDAGALDNDATNLFFADGTALKAMPKGGGGATTLAQNQVGIQSIANDATHLYWLLEDNASQRYLRRVSKGGGAVQELDSIGVEFIGDVALDATDVYYSHSIFQGNAIVRVPKAGGAKTVIASGNFVQRNFALSDSYVFYNNFFDLRRIPKAGGASTFLFQGFAECDGTNLFYGDGAGVHRRDLDGAGDTILGSLAGWDFGVRSVDDTHVLLSATGPAGAYPNPGGASNKAFLFAVPKAGGTPRMITSSDEYSFGGVTSDTSHIYWSDHGKIFRLAK